jgi:hypothetical protein
MQEVVAIIEATLALSHRGLSTLDQQRSAPITPSSIFDRGRAALGLKTIP